MVIALCREVNSHTCQPKLIGSAATHELWAKHDGKVSEIQGPETTTKTARHDGGKVKRLDALPTKGCSVLHNCDEQCQTHAESATAVEELRTQVTELKSEYSVLDGTRACGRRGRSRYELVDHVIVSCRQVLCACA